MSKSGEGLGNTRKVKSVGSSIFSKTVQVNRETVRMETRHDVDEEGRPSMGPYEGWGLTKEITKRPVTE